MRGHYQGDALLMVEFRQEFAEANGARFIQCTGRLVRQQKGWTVD
jgi:hypothetical protein